MESWGSQNFADCQAAERKANRDRPFEEKESYRWVEALKMIEKQFHKLEKHSQQTQQQLEKTWLAEWSKDTHHSRL